MARLRRINRNMRCIEIQMRAGKRDEASRINRNMRCIEIHGLLAGSFAVN